jgi:hypothetical protein
MAADTAPYTEGYVQHELLPFVLLAVAAVLLLLLLLQAVNESLSWPYVSCYGDAEAGLLAAICSSCRQQCMRQG